MNYIDELALRIAQKCGIENMEYTDLARLYAVLVLTKGKSTTCEDVHNAWSAWCAAHEATHRSLIPFDLLTKEVQELDQPYVDAIHAVSI